VEGSNYNKAVEIYNNTGVAVSLQGYEIWSVINGGDWIGGMTVFGGIVDPVALEGVLGAGETLVVCHDAAGQTLVSYCDLLVDDGPLIFNGNDAVGLYYMGTLLDAVGRDGEAPETGWDVSGVVGATKDHTMRRVPGVIAGEPDWSIAATDQWMVLAKDSFDGLGSHMVDGTCPEPDPCGDGVCEETEDCSVCPQDCGGCDSGCGEDIFFSQYVEGSGQNKALEIHNETGMDVSLADYAIWRIANGGTWQGAADDAFLFSGVLEAGATFVLCHEEANAEILAVCDMPLGYGPVSVNGNDALALVRDGLVIDTIGAEGEVGAEGWTVADVAGATKNHTLVRKGSEVDGDPDWALSAATQWLVFEQDNIGGLGAHAVDEPCQLSLP